MSQDSPDLDQRLSRFEAQLDRFSLALHQWQQTRAHSEPESPRDVDLRIRTLEETLDREAVALRRMHEEPLKQLQAQAANLRAICSAATVSVSGLDQAESRLAAIQTDVHFHLSDLSRTLQSLVADLRAGASTALSTEGPTAAWPLDRIVHLHDELRLAANGRDAGSPHGAPSGTATASHPRTDSDVPAPAEDRAGRVQFLQPATRVEQNESPSTVEAHAPRRLGWYVGGALIAAAAVFAFALERRIETKLNDAGARLTAAERQAAAATQFANQEAVAAREEANRQIVAARESAQRAETVGAILTAPDLIRFSLTSGASVDRSSAQVLWSRTRGLVFSASRLPAAPPATIYQLWLKTSAEPVNAGIVVPDATGRATLVTDVPPKVTGPVVGAEVTIEPSGGVAAPSGRALLVRFPQS
jgi:hypothetical protein